MTVPQTPVSTVVSLLSKKPKKSCLSKPWAAAVHQSSPTRTENIAQPFIDGEVTTIGSCTPPQQLSSAEDATPAVKEVNEMGKSVVCMCKGPIGDREAFINREK